MSKEEMIVSRGAHRFSAPHSTLLEEYEFIGGSRNMGRRRHKQAEVLSIVDHRQPGSQTFAGGCFHIMMGMGGSCVVGESWSSLAVP